MKDFAAYVFVVNRFDLLRRAIDAFPTFRDELTIVDNSPDGLDYQIAQYCAQMRIRIWRPPVPLTYSQTMNWMLKDATEKDVDFIAHFHSDASSTNPNADKELLDYARRMKLEDRRWACLWSFYDIAWIINPFAARDVDGWDTTFPSYFTDQSQKMRWKSRGWETIDTHIEGVTHEGSATIRSDPELEFLHQFTFPLYSMLYQAMYGGEPGSEKFATPFGRPERRTK